MVSSINEKKIKSSHEERSSGIELLRIIAMFFILAHHFILHNSVPITSVPMSPTRFILHFIFVGAGKVGVLIFFSISAWFLVDGSHSLRKNCRTIWILERTLLFYSIVISLIIKVIDPSEVIILKSFFPITLNLWWYPTCYVLFLLIEPLINTGLRSIGPQQHIILAGIIIAVYGGMAFFPDGVDITHTPFYFILIYIIMAAYKWYVKPFKTKSLLAIILIGYILALPYFFWACKHQAVDYRILLNGLSIPTLCIGMGIFLLFERLNFKSKLINRLAACSFGVYLISDHPLIRVRLWQKLFTLDSIGSFGNLLQTSIIVLIAIYLLLSFLDNIRILLFKSTLDKRRGHLFDLIQLNLSKSRIFSFFGRFLRNVTDDTKR